MEKGDFPNMSAKWKKVRNEGWWTLGECSAMITKSLNGKYRGVILKGNPDAEWNDQDDQWFDTLAEAKKILTVQVALDRNL
jgi:hypothetical protein